MGWICPGQEPERGQTQSRVTEPQQEQEAQEL